MSSLIATLIWKNQTITSSTEGLNVEFTYENLTSNIPEIPFELNIVTNDGINVVYAMGKLQVTPEKVYMPTSINQWSRHHLSGWNITFTCQKYATTTELPIITSGVSSKVISPPGSYIADFREENATKQKQGEKSNKSKSKFTDQILGMLLTPTSLALIAALAVATIICAIKLRER